MSGHPQNNLLRKNRYSRTQLLIHLRLIFTAILYRYKTNSGSIN